MTITSVSVVIAVLVGGIEVLGVIGDQLHLEGGFWGAIGTLNDNFNDLGFLIIGIFVVAWLASYLIYRLGGFDRLDTSPTISPNP